jgi:hypothetical protein
VSPVRSWPVVLAAVCLSMSALPWYTNAEGTFTPGHGLGAIRAPRIPFERIHRTSAAMTFTVNKRLNLPRHMIPKYDQGSEGACVGFAWSWALSILNRRFYAARKLYLEAQFIDPWTDTPPEEGTSIVSGAEVLRDQGHWRFARGITFPLALSEGIVDFRYGENSHELRLAIFNNTPAVLAIPWFDDFDRPEWGDFGAGGKRWWIGRDITKLGPIRGWHAICVFGARDDIAAGTLVNSWGVNYPIVNVPYETLDHMFTVHGAQMLIPVDRR